MTLSQIMKYWKVWILLLVLFASLSFTIWLTDFDWGRSEGRSWSEQEENIWRDEHFENLDYQLKSVRCPARAGLELKDYWKCLWASTITAEGIEQHRKILWETYMASVDAEWEVFKTWQNASIRKTVKRRVRREVSEAENFTFSRMNAILIDNYAAFAPFPEIRRELKICQQQVLPALSLRKFLLCVRQIALHPTFANITVRGLHIGDSFLPTFQPTTFPPLVESEYDEEQFPLVQLEDSHGHYFELRFHFKPLEREEKLSNFLGADPYFDDAWSPYRYQYSTVNLKQHNIGWSYRGAQSSNRWHELYLEQFLLPLKDDAELDKVEYVPDFAQTYPGVGELAEGLGNMQTPLDYRWTKDIGYNIYTRFLLPLLQNNDLEYYKRKGMIDPSVTVKPDTAVLQDIIEALKNYENVSSQPIAFLDLNSLNMTLNPVYNSSDDAPFTNEYFKTLTHFYGIDLAEFKSIKKKIMGDESLHEELETLRLLLRAYVRVVLVQEACLKEMLEEHGEVRMEDPEDIQKAIEKAIFETRRCMTKPTFEDAIQVDMTSQNDDTNYWVTYDNLRHLYDSYFDRKEARQSYSLPKMPVEFPICKNNDPSPIDIRTDSGRLSTIKDYVFGNAAYQMNRFFMFFPLDGSPLLTVGIVNGQRLDESSVQLTGGAVRGQNLTFQYMHIRFGEKWNWIGSEHWINGKGAPVELQMVFTIAGSADSIKYWHILARVQNQLFQFREKLVIVLSVLVDVLEDDEAVVKKVKDENLKQDPHVFEALAQAAYHFRSIPEKYPNYEQPRGYVSIDPVFRFIDFIPRKSSKFYTYRGSLSWPPCFGYVIWSVYEQRLYMSKRQFDQFSNIPAFGVQDSNFVRENFRRFDDIFVEEEHNPSLTEYMVQALRKERTVDRSILVGTHDAEDDGTEREELAVVGDDVYFLRDGSSPSLSAGFRIEIIGILLARLSLW